MWVRAYDEAHNVRNYRLVTPEGALGDWALNQDGATRGKVAWGSLREIAKAVSVIENGALDNISAQLGEQHKVRNFYNNIVDPAGAHGSVTIDTHAVAAALLRPLSGASAEVGHNFGARGRRELEHLRVQRHLRHLRRGVQASGGPARCSPS
jgi:hypothetical protein